MRDLRIAALTAAVFLLVPCSTQQQLRQIASLGSQVWAHTYVIHLERREDRLKALKASFDPELWSGLRFVQAVDGHAPREELLATLTAHRARPCPGWVIRNEWDPVLFREPGIGQPFEGIELLVEYNSIWYTQQQTSGAICTGLSHHLVWEQIAQAKEDWAVILEDDMALPSANAYRQFVQDVNELHTFDIVYLYKRPAALLGGEPHPSTPRLQPLLWTFGAQAYAISKSFAQVLVKLRLPNCLTGPDEFINYAYNPNGHPRHEQWEQCFGKPPAGKGSYVYLEGKKLLEHIKESSAVSDTEAADEELDAEAKETVEWLLEHLNAEPWGERAQKHHWAVFLVAMSMLAFASAARYQRRAVWTWFFGKKVVAHHSA